MAPERRASRTAWIRSGRGTRSASARGIAGGPGAVQPTRPVSSDRSALPNASAKVRPSAMTSPTDFIWTPRTSEAPGNFSNAKRGILTTT